MYIVTCEITRSTWLKLEGPIGCFEISFALEAVSACLPTDLLKEIMSMRILPLGYAPKEESVDPNKPKALLQEWVSS